jgi:enoyl-CoA hydratase/carnithine racemase
MSNIQVYRNAATLEVELQGHILVITLNRPERLNSINRQMQLDLQSLFLRAKADPQVRVVVMTGAGRAFCAGADVSGLQDAAQVAVEEQLSKAEPTWTARQVKMFKPTIVAVNGVCAAAGFHFVADSDIVIASDKASFTDTHVNVGQVTAMEPVGLLQKISLTTVLRLVILGKAERLSAAQALECQLVSEVLPPEGLMPRAMELARIAAAVSPASVQKSLQAVWDSLELPLEQAYARGYELLIRHREHPDALEGTTAFLEKRAPVWKAV